MPPWLCSKLIKLIFSIITCTSGYTWRLGIVACAPLSILVAPLILDCVPIIIAVIVSASQVGTLSYGLGIKTYACKEYLLTLSKCY